MTATSSFPSIALVSAAGLVEFYNLNVPADKQITRFSDRKTAERRVNALIDEINAAQQERDAQQFQRNQASQTTGHSEHGCVECPGCGIDLRNGVSRHGDVVNGKPLRHDTHMFECLACSAGFGKALRAGGNSTTRSGNIAKSWSDTSIAMARAQRTSVRVSDAGGIIAEYGSVAKAFLALELPMGRHIAFRMALKAAGAKDFGGYQFAVVAA